MKSEEKYKIGMFKNVHPDVMKFIHENSNTVCPFGIYDNTVVCSQAELIRLVNPILEQLEKEREFKSKLLKHCINWRNFLKTGSGCDATAAQVYQEIIIMIDDDYETKNQE